MRRQLAPATLILGEVLMLAYRIKKSISWNLGKQGQSLLLARSRQTYWRKGESSGPSQTLCPMSLTVTVIASLLKVNQEKGPALYTIAGRLFLFTGYGNDVGDQFGTLFLTRLTQNNAHKWSIWRNTICFFLHFTLSLISISFYCNIVTLQRVIEINH